MIQGERLTGQRSTDKHDRDGYDATRAIRRHADPAVRDVLVIAMTASAIRGDREKCLEAGMNSYLAKPVRAETLKQMLESYLDQPVRAIPNLQEEANSLVDKVVSQEADRRAGGGRPAAEGHGAGGGTNENDRPAQIVDGQTHAVVVRPKTSRKQTTEIHLSPEEMAKAAKKN